VFRSNVRIETSVTVLLQVQYLRRGDVWLQNLPQLMDSRCDISKNEYIPTEGTVLLGYGTASLDDLCPTFRESLVVSSSTVECPTIALFKGSSRLPKISSLWRCIAANVVLFDVLRYAKIPKKNDYFAPKVVL